MAYLLPTISDFKAQFVRDFPYATALRPRGLVEAQVQAALSGDLVSAINVLSGGSAYKAPTFAVVYGGGGVGCLAHATISSGSVASVTVDNPGFGYKTPPAVYVSSGGDNTDEEKVTDFDLASAFTAAFAFNITQALFGSQQAFTYAYNLLAAHYLCTSVRAGGTGLHGQAEWIVTAKTVANVMSSYAIPDRVLKSPTYAKYSKTTYGSQFLELISPQLVGNFQSFHRASLP